MSTLYKDARELAKSGMRPTRIASELDIRVLYLPFEHYYGMALQLDTDIKFIIINSGLSEAAQEFVCGHELGHFLLHPSTNFLFILQKTYFYSQQEYQANRFACELILGERAEKYFEQISEASASGKLDRLVELIRTLDWED